MRWNRFIRIMMTALLLIGTFVIVYPSAGEEEHPIEMTITLPSDLELTEAGTISYLTFTLENKSDQSYTLYDAILSGGFDGSERPLNDEIEIPQKSKKEFTLQNVSVADDQLDVDIVFVLSWKEHTYAEDPLFNGTDGDGNLETGVEIAQLRYEEIDRSVEATIRIERFVPPALTLTVSASEIATSSGETFTVTYRIANETKYDMNSLQLTDPAVYEGNIPLPGTDLMAGATISVPVTYTMGEEDMIFQPVLSYIAAHRPTQTQAAEPLTVGSVLIGIRLDVEQYPSNEEGSTFAITVTNTGNRAMKDLQLYDEINTEIDRPFDLGPQQQKVFTFTVPSAYASGLIRTVRFHITGKDFFDNSFTYTDANSYDCVPYITSDAVRLSLLANITDAYYDENGKLCGTIQFEIRNYSDVRVTNAVLTELTLFGTVITYDELQRGETFYTAVYQLDNIRELSFRLNAKDQAGQMYATDTVVLNLEQLPTLAKRTEEQTLIYHSNAFLKDLSDRISKTFRNSIWVVVGLVSVFSVICVVLYFFEYRITSTLPRPGLLSIRVPNAEKKAKPTMDHVLAGSPAEQLGYVAPAKIRYGTPVKTENAQEDSLGDFLFAPFKKQMEENRKPSIESQKNGHMPVPELRQTDFQTIPEGKEPVVSQWEDTEQSKAGEIPQSKPVQNGKQLPRVIEAQPLIKRRTLRPNVRVHIGSKGKL
ncbi:MAG: hypothetical protein IJK01_01460 [Clostridia bacterium]|nr:hypothetical protein [Clostridia bacterium]